MHLFFWFDLFLEARAEVLKNVVGILGDLKTPKERFKINWPLVVVVVVEVVVVVCIIWSTYYDQTHWVVCLLLQTLWIQRFIGAAKNLLFNGGHLKPIPPTHSTIWHYWQIASVIWYILVLVCREIWLSQYYIASRVEVLAKVNTIEYMYIRFKSRRNYTGQFNLGMSINDVPRFLAIFVQFG